ncbi:DUF2637 domain-containing protein [Streptomyces sp. NPDC093544]|uniref:DUF2637 domain-containing protein n=1 Tax=Streptomyces sp. NPDC093544 TaxID=3155200 RepID=UPI0034274526
MAYASCGHQRAFALQGGAEATSAALRPLSVDGLLLVASIGLLKPTRHVGRRVLRTLRRLPADAASEIGLMLWQPDGTPVRI